MKMKVYKKFGCGIKILKSYLILPVTMVTIEWDFQFFYLISPMILDSAKNDIYHV